MSKYELSILIPARQEMFLERTIQDILENSSERTEIIVGLDGALADPPITQHERVTVIYHPVSIGQRAMTNELCRLSKATYVMKLDAHCAMDKDFDTKLIESVKGHDDWTVVPLMRNLNVFDWICKKCGNRWYQGAEPTSCQIDYKTKNPKCDNTVDFEKDIVWIAKPSPRSTSYCFDSEPHFQYFGEWCKRQPYRDQIGTGITETMSIQGSCFMMTRDKYWELGICDEGLGSWGSQGIEVACKTWLSGGRVVCNHNTWYAHLFRTQEGFGFPYPNPGSAMDRAKKKARDLFFNNKWDKAIHPITWLLEKFWPIKGWTEEDLIKLGGKVPPVKKGIIFYTDNQLNLKIARGVQKQLSNSGLPIVSASLKPMDFGKNVHVNLRRGYLAYFTQILSALEASTAEYVFFCEHDCLYPSEHFNFTPPTKDKFYYNLNVWKINYDTGHAIHYDCKQVSGICVDRILAITHYKKRLEIFTKKCEELKDEHEINSFVRAMGFEPGTHNREERVDDLQSGEWMSEVPIVDIRHGANLSKTRWHKEEFRSQRNCPNWVEGEEIPSWGKTGDILKLIK